MARKRKRSLLEQGNSRRCSILINSPAEKEESTSPKLTKYWLQRYNLFSRYDEGIEMDEEGWYSVTPEEIAVKQAERCRGKVVIDCFSGVGGNTIQFAKVCSSVIAIDIDPVKVEMAINNALVYGVDDRVDYVVGDFIHLAPSLKGDVLFLSPPWGGPMYNKVETYTLDMLQPKDGYKLFQIAQTITPNIIMFLPRNVDLAQLEELAWLSSPPLTLEIEENCVGGRIKGITAYFSCCAV
ncbi:trimethylguanosine synthase isoform X1 [Brassica rapa]|uniref:trimethylguanosine synthase isoform X1 n=1 Tax=Brassica campestris TaxID=3711 RepID=UPI0004F14F72|nr:trimethylguanosine synthase isoform X1 [Brassica rapa]